ncbi:hypothetical protein O6H91_02G089200 [Diphasiastrum complanatum]|uniref:Uncharacterized protein n=1 Tax=Diphasiastrum complanatum TaxID=34168 RepID=A0ACC2EI30_DIPCM|nr:hypothetical protein O6H91_02G089200 [Diphasiastrum complanatum]
MAGVAVAGSLMFSSSSHSPLDFAKMANVSVDAAPPTDFSSSSSSGSVQPFEISSHFNPSMAIIVVVLLSTFFFMGFFSVYLRRCVGAQRERESLYQSMPVPVQHSMQGLDKATIASFPVISFSLVRGLKKGKTTIECPVCLTEFQEQESIRVLKCGHCFHLDCIDMWLFSHTTCPLCRRSLLHDPDCFSLMHASSEAAGALERRLGESGRSTQSLSDEVRLTVNETPTQNDINRLEEALSPSRVGEREAAIALSKNSESFRSAAQDLERIEGLSPSSARDYSASPRADDGSPSSSTGLKKSTSSTLIPRVRSCSMLTEVFKRSQGTEEGREQLLDHDGDFSFEHNLEPMPVSWSFTCKEANKNEDAKS